LEPSFGSLRTSTSFSSCALILVTPAYVFLIFTFSTKRCLLKIFALMPRSFFAFFEMTRWLRASFLRLVSGAYSFSALSGASPNRFLRSSTWRFWT
jgi:hypothetical protein